MNKINQNWIFGQGASLNLANNTPIPGTFPINTFEGCASVSDANGNLLFYTDGKSVWEWDGTNSVLRIPNTSLGIPALNGDSSSTQSAIIVPDPASNDGYYIFTAGISGSHIGGVRIDISNWSALPIDVVTPLGLNTIIYSGTEKVTAIQSRDCKAYWVITVLRHKTTGIGWFRVLKVDSSGVTALPDTVIASTTVSGVVGYLKGSPDGARIAMANFTDVNNKLLVFSFDNSTGLFIGGMTNYAVMNTLPINLTNSSPNTGHPRRVYGLEFSPNNNILYYSVLGDNNTAGNSSTQNSVNIGRGYIFQVDLISNNQLLIGTHENAGQSGRYALGALQLGMNGIIYVAQDGEDKLGTIQNPDVIGTGCNLAFNQITLAANTLCYMGLPNLLPNPCDDPCDCGCTGCNDDAEAQNAELIDRAKTKYNTIKSGSACADPFGDGCENTAINPQVNLEPCFYFHWGDGATDQIEEHDTEVFYITVCNPFKDVQYNGFRITKVTLIPNIHPLDKIHIVPDRFINLDCIEPCSCQTREFAMITRANDTAGNYSLEVEYCYESISLASGGGEGKVQFNLEITED